MASTDKFQRTEKVSTDVSDIDDQTMGRSEHKTSDSNPADELSGLPVDRGWAWIILFATTFEAFIYGGIMRSYGVFFVQFQERFESSAAETGLLQTVWNIFISVAGIIVMTIGMKHMTARTSVIIGTVATVGAYILAAFATRIEVLIFSLGAVSGIAAAMIYLPLVSTIGIYFNKRRGLANSFAVAGTSLGALVLGPLYTFMFDYYGYTGTMLITAGFMMNLLICGCLLRPPEFYTKRKKNIPCDSERIMNETRQLNENLDNGNANEESDKLLKSNIVDKNVHLHEKEDSDMIDKEYENDILVNNKQRYTRTLSVPQEAKKAHGSPSSVKQMPQFVALNFQRRRAQSFDSESAKNHDFSSPLERRTHVENALNKHDTPVSETKTSNHSLLDSINKSKIDLYSSADSMCASLVSLNFIHAEPNNIILDEIIKDAENHENRSCTQAFKSSIINVMHTVFDVSLLKDPVFIHYLGLASLSLPAAILTNVYFIPFAKDIGISIQDKSILLFVIGAVDLIGRLSVGLFADRNILKPTTIVACGFIMMAVVNNFIRLINSFWTMLIFVVIQGSLGGVYNSLFAVILIEHIGITRFKSALGFANMFHGGSVAIFFPVTGLLRDTSGAYYWTYHMLSILLILAAILAFTLPMTYKRTRKASSE